MQWNNDRYQQEVQQDVYADVQTTYASSPFAQTKDDTQEFSLSAIQQKLGELSEVEETDVRGASVDLMPSNQTLNMSYQREYAAEKTRTASKLNTKAKVAISCYAIVVLALILAVTLCSVSVTTVFGAAISLNDSYTEVSATVDELTAEIQAEDYAELDRRAQELGYTSASSSNTMTYTELETRPAQNFTVESNWFDALCDWLCNVFGA